MRTATPLRTWSVTTGRGQLGHVRGDLDPADHRARVHHDRVRAEQAGPARGEAVAGGVLAKRGDERPLPRSACRRSSETTSASASARSRSCSTRATGQPSSEGGSRVAGATRVTSAPRAAYAPDLGAGHPAVPDVAHDQHLQSLEAGRGPRRRRRGSLADRVESSSAWVGCSCQPSPALITAQCSTQPATCCGHARGAVADDHGVDAHRLDGLDRVAQRLALLDRRRGRRRRRARRPTAAWPRSRRTAGSGWTPRRRGSPPSVPRRVGTFGIGAPRHLGEGVRHPQHLADLLALQVVDAEQMTGERAHLPTRSPRDTPSSVTSTISSRLVGQVLADVVGPDRELTVAPVDHHRELDRPGPGRTRRAR